MVFGGALHHFAAEFLLVADVAEALALADQIERRLRDIDVAAHDELGHLAEEKRQQQRPDVRAVHVGVGHDDDLRVAEPRDVEFVFADAGAERRDEGADFLVPEHFVHARLLDVQDFSPQREDGLGAAVAAALCGAPGRVALDQEDFRARRVALLAV